MTALETVAAWPVGAAADKALQRTAVTKRFIWVFADTEDTQNFDVVDPADGTLPLYIQWKGILFQYDSTDGTTAHDGTTCAVTLDSKRYKAVAAIPVPYAVLSTSTIAQPGTPTIGDTYYIPTAATGAAWAGKDGQIGIYLARGWVFQAVRIGQFVYDESSDTYYHKTAAGTLTAGFGAQALNAGSVLPSQLSGGGGKVRWFVENQTTNAPPGSPSANVEYIIGSSPTGAWAGKAGQIARYENSAWVYYVPVAGWKAYDKSLSIDYQFNGTAWISAGGAVVGFARTTSAGGSVTRAGPLSGYSYSATVAPTKSQRYTPDPTTLTYTAKHANVVLEFEYCGTPTWAQTGSGANTVSGDTPVCIALFRDGGTTAVAWRKIADGTGTALPGDIFKKLYATAPDASPHTYQILIINGFTDGGSNDAENYPSALFQTDFAVREYA